MKKIIKSILIILLSLVLILLLIFVFVFHKIIFQEGNPFSVGIGIIKLEILDKDYVTIGKNKYIAKNDKFDIFLVDNSYVFKDRLGAGVFLEDNYGNKLYLSDKKFTKNYNIYEISSSVTHYSNAKIDGIKSSDSVNMNNFGYEYSKGNLRIDYPNFLKKMDNILVSDLIKKIKNDTEILELCIKIENINGDDFDLINKLISSINFEYYDYKFDVYSDENNFIFNSLENKNKITELNLHFNHKLSGNNTLIKTLQNIKRINNKTWSYFWVTGENDFMNNYKMTSEEIDIIHSMDLYGVYLGIYIENNKELDKKIEEFVLDPKFAEYTLFKKFSKGAGLSGIYKTLDSGEQLKIADFNDRF